jgi:hypothetical protein
VRLLLAAVLVAGCGRIGFSPGETRDGAIAGDDDAARDASSATGDAVPCAHQLCDDFESATLAPVWMMYAANSGTATLDTTIAHSGASSLKFSIPAVASGGSHEAIYQTETLAIGSPTFYVRAFVRFSVLAATNNRMELIYISEQTNGFEDAVFLEDSGLALYNEWSDATVFNGSIPPTNTWLCVTWRVTRATDLSGSMALAGDVPPASQPNIQTEGPTVDAMGFGVHLYGPNQGSPQPALDMWLDDVLIDASPLACSD